MLLRACPRLSGRHECPNQSLEAPPFFGVPGRGTERTGLPEQRRLDLRQAGSCLLHRPQSSTLCSSVWSVCACRKPVTCLVHGYVPAWMVAPRA